MASYRLSTRADADILEVVVYTVRRFGVEQGRRYHDGLKRAFQALAEHPTRGRGAAELAPNLRRWKYESHIVFYVAEPQGILIVRVLHQAMDIRRHPMNDG